MATKLAADDRDQIGERPAGIDADPDRPRRGTCAGASQRAGSSAAKPTFECVPSQNGLFDDWPQRQR